jgi:NAD(P)-dependent dehydrogenase (short-subunit alcohol dehydrogenase family)
MVADRDASAASSVVQELGQITSKEFVTSTTVDIRSREAIREAINATIAAFGGADILVNTAAMFPSSPDGVVAEAQWTAALDVNVTAN